MQRIFAALATVASMGSAPAMSDTFDHRGAGQPLDRM
jgi:hypothetical protein